MINVPPIESDRLKLISMSPAFLEACLIDDRARAADLIGLHVPPEWFENGDRIKRRLDQLRRDPSLQPWLLRAITLRGEPVMIGHINFHDRPGADYLAEFAPGGVELGYSVFAPFQRRGIATEAAAALMAWAQREHGVTRFVLSISPDNEPSLRIARHFGFRRIGTQIDPIDGPEDVFVRPVSASNI